MNMNFEIKFPKVCVADPGLFNKGRRRRDVEFDYCIEREKSIGK